MFGRARAHHHAGDRRDAERLYRRILQDDPTNIDALHALGTLACEAGDALHAAGRLGDALAAFDEACALAPAGARAYLGLASVLRMMGHPLQALACSRRAVEVEPDSVAASDALLRTLLYVPDVEVGPYLTEHLRWDAHHGLPLARFHAPHANDPAPERRLRIGYLAPDFRAHAAAPFVEPLFAAHDRARYTAIVYASVAEPDDVTRRLAGLADVWRDVSVMDDEQVAALVRADGIDVLVDLAGHGAGNRLPVIARKPAPVQVSHSVAPTGLSAIDFLVGDAYVAPALPHGVMAETLLRLPGCATCYAPPPGVPAPSRAPAVANGFVTFGSFASLAKINADVIGLWAAILHAVPRARLLLKSSLAVDRASYDQVVEAFAAHGVGDRVACVPRAASVAEHFARYAAVDIALDTFPFNGRATTCEALWMGVPVVTLAGRLFADRLGVSLLSTVGLPELVAGTPEYYVRLAVALAADPASLDALRAGLRDQVARSALCDADGYARGLERAYRDAWRQWCRERASRAQAS
jgi:predicted O-linked N-acetylglucosamine transferase (SPINDLY family)